MVVVLELDDEDGPLSGAAIDGLAHHWAPAPVIRDAKPNGLSAILACYPVAVELASFLDLNTLHSLSRTCQLIRMQLLQHRRQLMSKSLRCSNERYAVSGEQLNGSASARYQSWDVAGSYGVTPLRVVSEKLGPCARDMVGECRRCRRIVCRNCIMKPPSAPRLPNRLRRLCLPCCRAPLAALIGPAAAAASTPPSASTPASSASSATSATRLTPLPPLPPLTRPSCSCYDEVYVCAPCGHATSSADLNYRRLWEWRTWYSTHMGGLGTGIGEGNEGVQCARDAACLAHRDIEVEVDCPPEDLASLDWVPVGNESGADGSETESSGQGLRLLEAVGENGEKAGYMRQEVEGIGGVVRTKYKKHMRVGMTVDEHEDERASGAHLSREARGDTRCWCGWCDRVVLGAADLRC